MGREFCLFAVLCGLIFTHFLLNMDKQYWSQRYQEGQTGWDIGGVSAPLAAYFDQLEDKNLRILIPGAGNAHEAAYLFQKD